MMLPYLRSPSFGGVELHALPRRWNVRTGWGCRRPFLGLEVERLANGRLVRVSLWPMRYGFHFMWWKE